MNHYQDTKGRRGSATGEDYSTRELNTGPSPGPWTVEVRSEEGVVSRIHLQPGQRAVIGSRCDSDLCVRDSWVSGRHCMLDASGESLVLRDLSSKNGVHVANVRVSSAVLDADPSTFTIGKSSVLVRSERLPSPMAERERIEGLEGNSEPIQRLRREILRLARLRAPVLIVGESGVGKDVVARALHVHSRRPGAFVPINVATIPESLADSELFGHRKGAFTGAHSTRKGAFEQAHQGTLFLDEIGELAPTVQARLLRILEDGVVRPVGAAESTKVDVRVVSATWARLTEKTAAGRFRFDLLQRLSMVVVEVPPLRERRSDIHILSDYWLRRHSAELGLKHLSQAAIERLREYDWPGNVRELGGVIYRSAIISEGEIIEVEAVVSAILRQGIKLDQMGRSPRELLERTGGNVSEAARLAGLPRTTFRCRLERSQRRQPIPQDE